jgi:hypothetical protein
MKLPSWLGPSFQPPKPANTPSFDAALEEMKEEDFLMRLKRLLPLMVLGASVVLVGAGVYTVLESRRESSLYKAEKIYAQALKAAEEGQWKEAEAKFSEIKDQPQMAFLVALHLSRFSQKNFALMHFQEDWQKIKKNYATMEKRFFPHSMNNGAFHNFSTMAMMYLTLDKGLEDKSLESRLAFCLQEKHAFRGLALGSQALRAFLEHQENAPQAMSTWEKKESDGWIPTYCALGAGFSRLEGWVYLDEPLDKP